MANWLQRGMVKLAGLDPSQITGADPQNERYWGYGTSQSLAGQVVTAESALQLDVVQSVLERLAGTLSSLPLMVYERVGSDEKKPAPDHPLFELLHSRPNGWQTAQEFRDEQTRHLAFYRNCYAQIVPGPDGPIGALEPIHPDRVVQIQRNADRRIYYTVRRLDDAGTDVFRDDDIWHIRKPPLSRNGLAGLPVWKTSRETIGRAQAIKQFGALYFANGGSGGGFLEHPGTFNSKEDREFFLESYRADAGGTNRHRDRLLLNGVKYTANRVNNDEAQFIETTKESDIELCRLWNMPPHLVQALDKATFSNIEQQSIEYVTHTLAPWISAIEQAAMRDLLIGKDQKQFFVEFNVAALLRGDFKTRWDSYAKGRQWGWLSVNDIHRFENMANIGPEGDIYLVPMNMTPAGKPGEDAETPPIPDTEDPADPADAVEDETQQGENAPGT